MKKLEINTRSSNGGADELHHLLSGNLGQELTIVIPKNSKIHGKLLELLLTSYFQWKNDGIKLFIESQDVEMSKYLISLGVNSDFFLEEEL